MLGAWLATRVPPPPGLLAERLRIAAAPFDAGEGDIASRSLVAAEHELGALIASGSAERTTAIDLLASDALVTYAFEAAADDPERIPQLAHEAMRRLSALLPAP